MGVASDAVPQGHGIVPDDLPALGSREGDQGDGQNFAADDGARVESSPTDWQKAAERYSAYLDRSGLDAEKQSELMQWLHTEQQAVDADDFLVLSDDMDVDGELAFSAASLLEYARLQEAMGVPQPLADMDPSEEQKEQQLLEASSGGEAMVFGVATLLLRAVVCVKATLGFFRAVLARVVLAVFFAGPRGSSSSVGGGHEAQGPWEAGRSGSHLGHQLAALQGCSPSAAADRDVLAPGSKGSLGAGGDVQKLGAECKQRAIGRARAASLGGA